MKSTFTKIALATAIFTTAFTSLASAKDNNTEKSVVIVHGAFADGSGWDKVVPLLQAKGLHVVTVQNPLSSLANDVDATTRAINAQKGSVVLVGHSWGGVVITEAGDNDKVKSLVYVAAFAPNEGESVTDLTKNLPKAPWVSSLIADSGGYVSLPPQVIAEYFAPDLSPAQTQVMAATQGPILAKSFDEKVHKAAWKAKPSWYLVASQDKMIEPSLQRQMAKKINAKTSSVNASHVPFISKPEEVAEVILAAAAAIK